MNLITAIGLLIMGIGISAMIVLFLIMLYKKLFNPKSLLSPIQKVFNETQLLFVREIERMHSDNESKMLSVGDTEIYERITGKSTNGVADYNIFLGIEGWDDADPKSDLYKSGNYVSELMMDLNRRFVYEKLKFDEIVLTGGDSWARYEARMAEMIQSVSIIEQLIDNIPDGDFQAKTKNVLKLP